MCKCIYVIFISCSVNCLFIPFTYVYCVIGYYLDFLILWIFILRKFNLFSVVYTKLFSVFFLFTLFIVVFSLSYLYRLCFFSHLPFSWFIGFFWFILLMIWKLHIFLCFLLLLGNYHAHLNQRYLFIFGNRLSLFVAFFGLLPFFCFVALWILFQMTIMLRN